MMKKYLYTVLYCVFFFGSAHNAKAQIITTIAGTGAVGYSGDGGVAVMANLHQPLVMMQIM